MTTEHLVLPTPQGPMRAVVTAPDGHGSWPGVVVLHDVAGLTEDTRQQTQWLADAGFLTIAPDLFHGKNAARCMLSLIRDIKARQGGVYEDVEVTRQWLLGQPHCTGNIGVIGFCMGGGFALMLAFDRGFDAASVNYGTTSLTSITDTEFASACPIVASYGGNDRGNKGTAAALAEILTRQGTPHDVKEYPGVGHAFMNNHEDAGVVLRFVGWATGSGFDAQATQDSRRRITAFFREHLE